MPGPTVIDSSGWTGLKETNPYELLSTHERQGEHRFGGSRRTIIFGMLAALLLIAFGAFLLGREIFQYVETGRGAWLNIPFVRAILGVALIVFNMLAIPRMYDRFANTKHSAPLVINDEELRFGEPAIRLPLRSISSITLAGLDLTLPQLAERLGAMITDTSTRNLLVNQLVELEICRTGDAKTHRLDLGALTGSSPRVALMICDRIQKLRSSADD